MAAARTALPISAAVLTAALLTGCTAATGTADGVPGGRDRAPAVISSAPRAVTADAIPAVTAGDGPAASRAPSPSPEESRPVIPRTEPATLDIPAIGVRGLRVIPYEGTTDDWPGTRIQNRGDAASPYGEHGGVGPGEKGNYLVTAHRLSAGAPLRDLPSLRAGDTVTVTAGGQTFVYEITDTRRTSFRSARSLDEQRAAVPGRPGERPTRAMITISTCATPEDDAAGNFWRDDKGNPEHRIDKIGVLRESGGTGGG
ncbi:sortase [Streptomyces sp. CAU 1734]|uniref:class E sortase n=1 Tax=Streptomyces sp. CAU 1734 TaxID=3140360 RepID=UPI0032604C4B